jgi:hypothetical protein
MLLQSWQELTKRRRTEINDYSRSSAISAGAALTEPGRPIEINQYLPFPANNGNELPLYLQQICLELIEAQKLPAAMVADLYNNKFLAKKQ